MSRPTHVERCRQWIEEQIETMGSLRTANSRDLSFKNWRQNTVTVLQRIWPEDRERVERFRRISFTPPHARAEGKQFREWFGKGIGESRSYLQALLELIDREGVPTSTEEDRSHSAQDLEDEVAFPIIELTEREENRETEAVATPAEADDDGLGVTAGYGTPDDPTAPMRDASSPPPPSLQKAQRALPAERPETGAQPPALGEAEKDPAAKSGASGHSVVAIPRAPGLAGQPTPTAPVVAAKPPAEPAAPAPVAKSEVAIPVLKVEPKAPAAKAPAPAAPVPSARDTEPPALKPTPTTPAAKPAQGRVEAGGPRQSVRGRGGKNKQRKTGFHPKLRDMLGLDQFEARTQSAEAALARVVPDAPEPEPVAKSEPTPVAEVTPAPAPAPEPRHTAAPAAKVEHAPAPAAEPEPVADELDELEADDDLEEETLERARRDFMQNSPIFGVVGKPVQRRTDANEFLDPDAVAVSSFVADLGRLGVPEGMRSSMAARLTDVARNLEGGTL